jgi:hypothetical protein
MSEALSALSNIQRAAEELHRQEFDRLAAAVTPTVQALRSMTAAALRDEVALMWERLGHTVIAGPGASDIVTTKGERKFITACANPADPAPTGTAALCRLRNKVVATYAERGFYVTAGSFTAEARRFAETAPVQLIDGPELIRALQRSRKGMLLPQTYQAMCRQCGDIVGTPARRRRGGAVCRGAFRGTDDRPRRAAEAAPAAAGS